MDRTVDDEPVILARQTFVARNLRRLRQLVVWAARRVGLDAERGHDLAFAVSEAAGNVITHGGGSGQLALIQDDGRALIAQITDHGPGMPTPLPSTLPAAGQDHGRGLYLIQQTCDRVEYQTGPNGTIIHLEMHLHNE